MWYLLLASALLNLSFSTDVSTHYNDGLRKLLHSDKSSAAASELSSLFADFSLSNDHAGYIYRGAVANFTTCFASIIGCGGPLHTKKPADSADYVNLAKFIDAMGKPPTGLGKGSLKWLGDWDTCMDIHGVGDRGPYSGQYCTLQVFLGKPQISDAGGSAQPVNAINLGVCIPSTCNNTDLINCGQAFIGDLQDIPLVGKKLDFLNVGTSNTLCEHSERQYSPTSIFCHMLLGFMILLVAVATVVDLFLVWLNNRAISIAEVQQIEDEERDDDTAPIIPHVQKEDEAQGEEKGGEDAATSVRQTNGGVLQIMLKLIKCFSVYQNGTKLLGTGAGNELSIIHGMRFISILWVILGHSYLFNLFTADNPLMMFQEYSHRFSFMVILNGMLSVDTFFFLSGLLVVYVTLPAWQQAYERSKTAGTVIWFWAYFYLHRYIRLTPLLGVTIMTYVGLAPPLLVGPMWVQTEDQSCKDNWWTNILYINNFVNRGEGQECMAWTWYLALDMQFHLIAPLVIAGFAWFPVCGFAACNILVLIHFVASGVISRVDHISPAPYAGILNSVANAGAMANATNASNATSPAIDPNAYWDNYYIRPWCRVGPYAIGMVVGYVLANRHRRIVKLPWFISFALWISVSVLAVVIVYGVYPLYTGDLTLSIGVASLYFAVMPVLWAACLAWVVISCCFFGCRPVTALLGWSGFAPLSRLTYAAYLLHPLVILTFQTSQRRTTHFYDVQDVWAYCGHVVVTFAVAFWYSLAFEAPIMALESTFLRPKRH